MSGAVGRLLQASVARHVSAISRAFSASGVLRPVASRRTCLTNILWSGSTQAKFAFSTSSSSPAPAVTQHAPYFKGTAVVNGEFKELSLDDFKGKYLVLFFYPLDFTFVCPTEIIAFSDKANEFHDVNCEVVGVSVDSHFTHLAWINTPRKSGGLGHMNITLLSDLTKQIAQDYGVLLEGSGIALRGLFIIDPNGVIKHLSVNDLPVGRSVEETLRLVKAFQFVETHGKSAQPTGHQSPLRLSQVQQLPKNTLRRSISRFPTSSVFPAASHAREEPRLEPFHHSEDYL